MRAKAIFQHLKVFQYGLVTHPKIGGIMILFPVMWKMTDDVR